MKNLSIKFLLLLLMPLCVFMGCEDDDEITDSTPSIVFTTTRTSVGNIDLDAGTGPNIRGWAVAPAGLSQVSITADKTSGGEEILSVTNFDEGNSEKNGTAYEFNVLPNYSPEFTGITVTVMDVNNRTEQLMLDVQAIGGTAGPTITGLPEGPIEANVRPSVNIRPVLVGVVSSHWGLASVTFIEVYGEEEETVETVSDFGDTPNTYNVNKTPDYDKGLTDGMTGYKINAVDNKGNSSSYSVVVSVIDASAAPIVNFDEEMIEADLLSNPTVTPTISGNVDAFEGLASLNFYVVGPNGDEAFGDEITVFDDNIYPFSFDDFPYGLGVTGFKVVAIDNSGQTTTETLPVDVIAEDPDLKAFTNISIWAQGIRFDQPTAFSFDDGLVYMYDAQPSTSLDVAKSIHFIPAAPSNSDAVYDILSPSNTSFLPNNYFKEVTWPYYNETKLRIIEEGEIDFAKATSLGIRGLEMGETTDRVRAIQEGSKTVLFETENGMKGLIYLVSSEGTEGARKNDKMVFNIKYIEN